MPQLPVPRIIVTFIVGFFIWVVAIFLPKVIITGTIPAIATTQALELILSIIAVWIFGHGRFADYGFRRPEPGYMGTGNLSRVLMSFGVAVVLGMAATSVTLIVGAAGNPIARELNLPQIILFVWIFSSIIEEIFTRGFIQSHIARATTASINFGLFRIQVPVLCSALAFAAMHLILLRRGADATTIVIILCFTFSVGLLAGHERSRSNSLLPAIGVHMLANIGGLLGGIVYAIISVLTGHGLPVR